MQQQHHHNGLLTTVASLTAAVPPLSSLLRPDYKPLLGGLPLPPFLNNPLNNGGSAAKACAGNPYALSLAIGGSPGYRHNHISSPQRQETTTGGPQSMSELTKIAVTSNQKYAEFRENMLRNMETGRGTAKGAVKKAGGNSGVGSDLNQSYSPASSGVATSTPTDQQQRPDEKDEAYWERRRKNNEAAKRSRDARRQKENEIAVRASFLEQENIQLKLELVQLRSELGSMREQMQHRQLQQAN